jgi:hypothetical protein
MLVWTAFLMHTTASKEQAWTGFETMYRIVPPLRHRQPMTQQNLDRGHSAASSYNSIRRGGVSDVSSGQQWGCCCHFGCIIHTICYDSGGVLNATTGTRHKRQTSRTLCDDAQNVC